MASNGFKIVSRSLTAKNNQGMTLFWGKRYAIVTQELSLNNGFATHSYSVSIDVNVAGELHVTPSTATPA